jgi:hypothetical protein
MFFIGLGAVGIVILGILYFLIADAVRVGVFNGLRDYENTKNHNDANTEVDDQ